MSSVGLELQTVRSRVVCSTDCPSPAPHSDLCFKRIICCAVHGQKGKEGEQEGGGPGSPRVGFA